MYNKILNPVEWPDAYPLITQLRNMSVETFINSVSIQTLNGYALIGAFIDNRLVGVMGFRPIHTLARGLHLHIDDLVVNTEERNKGIGAALLDYTKTEARNRNMTFIFLDARKDAFSFYERQLFERHLSPSMRFPVTK